MNKEDKKRYMKLYNKKYREENIQYFINYKKNRVSSGEEKKYMGSLSGRRMSFKRLLSIHGISTEDWAFMYYRQHGLCKICKTWMDHEATGKLSPHVDHCHKTGVVRGLLCTRCNKGLGSFRDNHLIVEKALEYLMEFEIEQ